LRDPWLVEMNLGDTEGVVIVYERLAETLKMSMAGSLLAGLNKCLERRSLGSSQLMKNQKALMIEEKTKIYTIQPKDPPINQKSKMLLTTSLVKNDKAPFLSAQVPAVIPLAANRGVLMRGG
jgi:hypothetical protein